MNLGERVAVHARRDAVALRESATVRESLQALRGKVLPEKIVYFYVEDAAGRLVGVVPTRRLLAADAEATIDSIMVDRVVTLPATATLRDATDLFLKHRLLALPLVDGEGRLAGVLDISLFSDEVVALGERASIDDVFQTIGVHAARARQRSPWGQPSAFASHGFSPTSPAVSPAPRSWPATSASSTLPSSSRSSCRWCWPWPRA